MYCGVDYDKECDLDIVYNKTNEFYCRNSSNYCSLDQLTLLPSPSPTMRPSLSPTINPSPSPTIYPSPSPTIKPTQSTTSTTDEEEEEEDNYSVMVKFTFSYETNTNMTEQQLQEMVSTKVIELILQYNTDNGLTAEQIAVDIELNHEDHTVEVEININTDSKQVADEVVLYAKDENEGGLTKDFASEMHDDSAEIITITEIEITEVFVVE